MLARSSVLACSTRAPAYAVLAVLLTSLGITEPWEVAVAVAVAVSVLECACCRVASPRVLRAVGVSSWLLVGAVVI